MACGYHTPVHAHSCGPAPLTLVLFDTGRGDGGSSIYPGEICQVDLFKAGQWMYA